MRRSFNLNHVGQLCIGDTYIQYDVGRSAKVDLCLEKLHRFLRRKKKLNVRLENFLGGEDKRAKEQLLKKHDLIYFKELSSLKDAIEMFYEGIDTFLQSFSDLLLEKPSYPEKPFRLTESFYSELKKIESSREVLSVFVYDDSESDTHRRVSHETLRELMWEIFRDGTYLKVSIEEIQKRNRKIVNAKLFDLFTGKQLEYNV